MSHLFKFQILYTSFELVSFCCSLGTVKIKKT